MKKTYKINGQIFKTICGAEGARLAYNRKNPTAKLLNACDAYEFREIREGQENNCLTARIYK
jgi:hypothetical protein